MSTNRWTWAFVFLVHCHKRIWLMIIGPRHCACYCVYMCMCMCVWREKNMKVLYPTNICSKHTGRYRYRWKQGPVACKLF